MSATIEHLSSLIRVGAAEHGDEYAFALTVRWLSPVKVELLGLSRTGAERFTKADARSIRDTLVAAGVKESVWVRKSRGRNVTKSQKA